MLIAGMFQGSNNFDTQAAYLSAVKSVPFVENSVETALPQTEIYNIIEKHFSSPLSEGKTQKKAIVIGYDGCRADALSLADSENSGIYELLGAGGSAYISYCGGKNYPALNTQATSTAPGWCSMLTGCWADVHGISDNSIVKSNEHLTLLTTLVESGRADSSAFYVSWGGHFSSEDSTYRLEKEYAQQNGIDAAFVCADGDGGTYANVMADIENADCSDFIFSIFEYPDHTGHSTGFNLKNPDYVNSFAESETTAKAVINAVKARPAYESEDWLILITSDHGGYNTGHGNMTLQERMTFIAANKDLGYAFEETSAPVC